MKRGIDRVFALALAVGSADACAQFVDDSRNLIPFEQTDAWAMAYATSSSLMTGFGATPELETGDALFGGELGHIPRLSTAEQRVGLGGGKQEDLNKSPVFGRARLWFGLPYGFIGEIGYTPPFEIDGAKPRDLFALAIARRWVDRERWSLSSRIHGQIGQVGGDITCPREVAASTDPAVNPFQCLAPSRDRIDLNYQALEITAAFADRTARWHGHATLAAAHYEPQVQINAEQRFVRNRSVLISSDTRPYLALGLTHMSATRWQWSGEALYVPLDVDRPGRARSNEPFWSLRLMLRYRLSAD